MRRFIKHFIGFAVWCAILIKLQNESYEHGVTIGRIQGSSDMLRAFIERERRKEADRSFWDRVRWS